MEDAAVLNAAKTPSADTEPPVEEGVASCGEYGAAPDEASPAEVVPGDSPWPLAGDWATPAWPVAVVETPNPKEVESDRDDPVP